jgi:hypothetical protein
VDAADHTGEIFAWPTEETATQRRAAAPRSSAKAARVYVTSSPGASSRARIGPAPVADAERQHAELGWEPTHPSLLTDLENIEA